MRTVLLFALLTLPVYAETPVARPESERPNIVLIVIDTLRADRLAATRNGVAVMPLLRESGTSGWNFRRAVSAASWTKPSVTSILTSLYPTTHGLVRGSRLTFDSAAAAELVDGLSPEKVTMATYLKQLGYTTLAIQTNHLLGAQDGFAQGFDHYVEALGATGYEVNATLRTNSALLKEPFFLYLHYMDPHAPYKPPTLYRNAFGALPVFDPTDAAMLAKAGSFSNYYMDRLSFDAHLSARRKFANLSEASREFYRAMYDGDCRYVDAQVRRAHDEITKRWGNTVFVVTSDHGEEFWEHGIVGHGRSLEQELVHVPLLIFGAGISPRSLDETWVEGIDILPTIAELLDGPKSPQWQGRSLAQAALPPRPVFSETHGFVMETKTALRCVIDGNLKLLRQETGSEVITTISGENTSPNEADAIALRSALDAHSAAMKAHPMALIPPSQRGLDEEMLERLQALGYTAGETNP